MKNEHLSAYAQARACVYEYVLKGTAKQTETGVKMQRERDIHRGKICEATGVKRAKDRNGGVEGFICSGSDYCGGYRGVLSIYNALSHAGGRGNTSSRAS